MKLIQAVKVAALVGATASMALVVAPQASATPIVTSAASAAGGTMALLTPAKSTIKPDKAMSTESSPLAHTGTNSVPAIGFPAACANNEWVATRTEECNLNSLHPWTAITTGTGAITGTMTYLVSQDIRLSTTTSTITESITFDYAAATGSPAGLPSTIVWTSACGSPCAVTSIPTLTFAILPGQSRTFTVTYQDNPLAQAPDKFNTSHSFNVSIPGFLPSTGPDRWGAPLAIRCDNNTPSFTNPGCVVPDYPPNLVLPLSKYGAAAANALVGETNLPGTPGLSAQTPLTRGDPVSTNANRGITCSGFVPLPAGNTYGVVSDSCDEYPFASSQQSGGALGIPGSSCLEIVPKQDANGKWTAINLNTYTDAYPQICLRGHVNSILNSNVGSQALNPLYTLNRMMIGDKYTVQVTP